MIRTREERIRRAEAAVVQAARLEQKLYDGEETKDTATRSERWYKAWLAYRRAVGRLEKLRGKT